MSLADMICLGRGLSGGLLVDLGFLTLKTSAFSKEDYATSSSPDTIPRIEVSHPAVIEWRSVTVIALYVSTIARQACSRLVRD